MDLSLSDPLLVLKTTTGTGLTGPNIPVKMAGGPVAGVYTVFKCEKIEYLDDGGGRGEVEMGELC